MKTVWSKLNDAGIVSVAEGVLIVVFVIGSIFTATFILDTCNGYKTDSINVNVEKAISSETNTYKAVENKVIEDKKLVTTAVVNDDSVVKAGSTYDSESNTYGDPKKIRCTFYTDHINPTKSGQLVRHGIIAGKPEWVGKTAVLYACDKSSGGVGKVIGIYEVLDTGNGIDGVSIKQGKSIDVWFPNKTQGWNFINQYGDYVYMQLIDAQG